MDIRRAGLCRSFEHRRFAIVVRGLPAPNIFAGEHAFRWNGQRRTWEKAAQTIVHLAIIWEERA
jgi:hypothetical protein